MNCMKARSAAFTLAEMMIAMCGSVIVIGALLFSSLNLEKSLHSAERTAANQADQRRLLDYVARDLRRAIGVASTTSVGGKAGTRLSGAAVTVEGDTSLLISLPGYYQDQTPGNPAYDQALPVVAADNYVDYGSGAVHAAAAHVIFRKQFDASQNCTCFVRVEENHETVIVPDADNMHLQITVGADGKFCTVQASFRTSTSASAPLITEREDVLLRNVRID